MEKAEFAKRLTQLRLQKGVSARDMSLSIGQSPGYINNIENQINYPSMLIFFYICDYLGVTPKEFFDGDDPCPSKVRSLTRAVQGLREDQLDHLIALANDLRRR